MLLHRFQQERIHSAGVPHPLASTSPRLLGTGRTAGGERRAGERSFTCLSPSRPIACTVPRPTPPAVETLSSTKPVPGAKKVGESCSSGLLVECSVREDKRPEEEGGWSQSFAGRAEALGGKDLRGQAERCHVTPGGAGWLRPTTPYLLPTHPGVIFKLEHPQPCSVNLLDLDSLAAVQCQGTQPKCHVM